MPTTIIEFYNYAINPDTIENFFKSNSSGKLGISINFASGTQIFVAGPPDDPEADQAAYDELMELTGGPSAKEAKHKREKAKEDKLKEEEKEAKAHEAHDTHEAHKAKTHAK